MWAAVVQSDSSFMSMLEKIQLTEDTIKMRKGGEKALGLSWEKRWPGKGDSFQNEEGFDAQMMQK